MMYETTAKIPTYGAGSFTRIILTMFGLTIYYSHDSNTNLIEVD